MRDPKIERWLDSLLIKWEYKTKVPLSEVAYDSDSRNSNQIRFELIDDQHYQTMLESRKSGDEMTAILINRVESGYYILDGNHRYGTAEEVGLKSHDAYIVQVEQGSELELQLMLEPNTRLSSKQLDEREQMRWAIYLNQHYPKLKQNEIARRVGLRPSQVSAAINAHKAYMRAQKIFLKDRQTFNAWMKLAPSVQRTLNRIPNDAGLRYAVEVTTSYQLSSAQVNKLVASALDSGTDDDAIKCIDNFLDEETKNNTASISKGGAGREKPAWDFLKMHAGAVRNVSSERVQRELMSGTLDDKQVGALEQYLNDAREVIDASLVAVAEYKRNIGKHSPAKKVPAHILERRKAVSR